MAGNEDKSAGGGEGEMKKKSPWREGKGPKSGGGGWGGGFKGKDGGFKGKEDGRFMGKIHICR